MEEIDTEIGRLLKTIDDLKLRERTLVIFTSDNGPWAPYGDHAGTAGPLREAKGTAFEGGVRVPFLARWPGVVPAGKVQPEPAMTIDLFPTLAKMIGAAPNARANRDALYFFWERELHAVRSGRWKLHFPHPYKSVVEGRRGAGGKPAPTVVRNIELALFDLEADVGETTDVQDRHPDVVARLSALADRIRADLGDSLTGVKPTGQRPPGLLPGATEPNRSPAKKVAKAVGKPAPKAEPKGP
jgi:arylsulfatase A-like enzyme